MRTPKEVATALELVRVGVNDCEIARRTGIPRGTVRCWRIGRVPKFDRKPGEGDRIGRRCEQAITDVLPVKVNKVRRQGCFEVYSYSKHWICLFPQHGSGRKHERKIELTGWQQDLVDADPRPLLRGLLHSDGFSLSVARRDSVALLDAFVGPKR